MAVKVSVVVLIFTPIINCIIDQTFSNLSHQSFIGWWLLVFVSLFSYQRTIIISFGKEGSLWREE